MANFNVSGGEVRAPNTLGYSRGSAPTEAQKSIATTTVAGANDPYAGKAAALKGAGDLFNVAVEAKDQIYQRNIKKELYEKVDGVRDEFGVGSAAVLQEDIGAQKQPLPDDIKIQGENLDALAQKYQSGDLQYSHYLGRLESITRQLRARYPGYREQIDAMVSNITGLTPANRLVTQLQEEASRKARKSPADIQDEFANKHLENLPPGYFENKDKWGYDALRSYVQKDIRNRYDIELKKKNLELGKANREDITERGADTYRQEAILAVERVIFPATGEMADFRAKISKWQEQAAGGKPFTAQEQAEMRGTIGKMRQAAMDEVNRLSSQYAKYLPQGKIREVQDTVSSFMDNMERGIVDKNYGLLAFNASLLDNVKEGDQLDLMGKNPVLREINAAGKLMGPDVLNLWLTRNQEVLNSVTNTSFGRGVAAAALGTTSVKDVLRSEGARPGVQKDKLASAIINSVVEGVKDPNTSDNILANSINSLYGPGNQGFLAEVPANKRHDMFLKVANESTAKRVYELAQRTGNSDLWTNYRGWVSDTSLNLMQQDIAAAREILINRKYVDLNWDPKQKMFMLGSKTPKDTGNTVVQDAITDGIEKVMEASAREAVNKLNKNIRSLQSIYSQEKGDIEPILGRTLDALMTRVYGDAKFEGPTSDNLFKALRSVLPKALTNKE